MELNEIPTGEEFSMELHKARINPHALHKETANTGNIIAYTTIRGYLFDKKVIKSDTYNRLVRAYKSLKATKYLEGKE